MKILCKICKKVVAESNKEQDMLCGDHTLEEFKEVYPDPEPTLDEKLTALPEETKAQIVGLLEEVETAKLAETMQKESEITQPDKK